MEKKTYIRWLCTVMTVFCFVAALPAAAWAKTILFVPQDDRPVSFREAVETAQAAGFEVLTPPAELLASRGREGNPEAVWDWVMANGRTVDAMVLSADTLVYGGLVDSRIHHLGPDLLWARQTRFDKLKKLNPTARQYVFATIMRTPRMTAGGVEPSYYEKHGPNIFELTVLLDKEDVLGLTSEEKRQLKKLKETIPKDALEDWFSRRDKNFQINQIFVDKTIKGDIQYLLLGRDDTAPFSQTHKEARLLVKQAAQLPASRFASFPGADQLGMLLLTRAINDLEHRVPVVSVQYALGTGPKSLPTYEDQPIGKSIVDQIVSAGGIVLPQPQKPDLVLAVHTSPDGHTDEAEWVTNITYASAGTKQFVANVAKELARGQAVAIGNISFVNGSDNSLMQELSDQKLLGKLTAYSGWNTPSNTLGFAISQGMLAPQMTTTSRQKLLAERYLDDWAYQANIRSQLNREIVYAKGGSLVQLDALEGELTVAAQKKLREFAKQHLDFLQPEQVQVSFPWNRMFEIDVRITPPQK